MKIEDYFEVREAKGRSWEKTNRHGWFHVINHGVAGRDRYLNHDGEVRLSADAGWFRSRDEIDVAFRKWTRKFVMTGVENSEHRFIWAIEKLCGEKPPRHILVWSRTSPLFEWIKERVPEGVNPLFVIAAADAISEPSDDWRVA